MASIRGAAFAEKRGRKKKSKSRTQIEVSSSSESDSDTPQPSRKKPIKTNVVPASTPHNGDITMADAHEASSSHSSASPSPAPVAAPVPASVKEKAPQQAQDEFSSIYLKKITAELADDLVKVRDAQDFKASSLPMLVHALRQGSSIYSAEEKRRVVNAAD